MVEQFRTGWWAFAVFACAAVLALAMLPPFVGPGFRYVLMQGFDLTCHQIPERSFQVGGVQFALCHRCTAVVAGLAIGSLAVVVFRKVDGPISVHLRTILILSVLPMIVDWGVDAVGLGTSIPFSRVATGLVFGLVAGYTFARALAAAPLVSSSTQTVASERHVPSSHPTPISHAQ